MSAVEDFLSVILELLVTLIKIFFGTVKSTIQLISEGFKRGGNI